MKREEATILKGIAICYKPFLKPEEAMIYCNLGATQLSKKLSQFGIYKSPSGYYKKEDLDSMMAGESNKIIEKVKKINI